MRVGSVRPISFEDPLNEIEEADEDNNCLVNHIRLSGMEGPNKKKVEVLGIIEDHQRNKPTHD